MTLARLLLLCCLLVSLRAVGQDAIISDIDIDDADATARIRSEVAEMEALQGLDADTRTAILEQLRDVETSLQRKLEVDWPARARERIGQLEVRRKELTTSREKPTVVGEQPMLGNATRLAAQFRRAAYGAAINKLKQDILSHAVRLDLLRTKLEVAARSQGLLKKACGPDGFEVWRPSAAECGNGPGRN